MDAAQFLSQVDEEFLCTICHDVMVNPHFCRDGHQFCLECITSWLQRSKTCPSDRKRLVECRLTKNPMARNLISKLVVRCSNAAAGVVGVVDGYARGNGCKWSGALSERDEHLKNDCAFVEVQCGSAGCYSKVQRAQLADHEAACEHREVGCEKCPARFTARESDQHQLTCTGVEIECLLGCGTKVRRGDLVEHEQECGEVVVCCQFAEHGCQVRGKRRKISEHEEEATSVHLQLATRTTKHQREESSRLAEQVVALQTQLKDCQAERSLALAQAARSGHAKVVWKIADFTKKLKHKRSVCSKTFLVETKEGPCPMQLDMTFSRKAGSETQGFASFFVKHLANQGGLMNFPIKLAGTRFQVESVVGGSTYEYLFDDEEVRKPGGYCGVYAAFKTKLVDDVTWSDFNRELYPILTNGCDRDATDYLEGDTMTLRATFRVTPAEELYV